MQQPAPRPRRSPPARRLIPGERRAGACVTRDSGDRSGQWEGGRRGSRRPVEDSAAAAAATTTRGKVGDSRGDTRERGVPVARFPLGRRARPCGIPHGRRVARCRPGGKSDGGVLGEVYRLVGTPIHAHSPVAPSGGVGETARPSPPPFCLAILLAAHVASAGTDTTSRGIDAEIVAAADTCSGSERTREETARRPTPRDPTVSRKYRRIEINERRYAPRRGSRREFETSIFLI